MKIQSKLSWKFYILTALLLLSNIVLTLIFFKIINDPKKVSFEILVIPFVFLSIAFPLFIMIVRSIKTLIIENDEIKIKFLFRKTYKLNTLVGYKELINHDKFGEYKTFYFKTDSKIFKFSNREFENYYELSENILNKTQQTEINIFFEMKIFMIAFLATLSTLFLVIWIGNQ